MVGAREYPQRVGYRRPGTGGDGGAMTVHDSAQHPAGELGTLARHLRGRLIAPCLDWDTARRPWKFLVYQPPAAIVEPESADDMTATVSFAARYGLRVTTQGSGHGAGADLADTILLRTAAMREITMDPARNLVRVGAGVRCRDLAAAASPHELAASLGSGPPHALPGTPCSAAWER